MLLIGITGSLGTGKSTFAEIIRSKGYEVIDMDFLAKEIMSENTEVRKQLIDTFGEKAFEGDKLSTAYLASIVYAEGNDKELEKLNIIVHPRVIEELATLVEKYENNGTKLLFAENAILYEMGIDEGFDYIINVSSTAECAFERVSADRNLSRQRFETISSAQLSAEQKKGLADFTIVNNSSLEELERAAVNLLDIITFLPEKDFSEIENDSEL